MKNLTWQYPEQLFVAQVLINKVKSKCCGIKVKNKMMATASNAIPNIVLLLNLSIIALKQFIYLLMYK